VHEEGRRIAAGISQPTPYKCMDCGKCYKSQSGLTIHSKTKHQVFVFIQGIRGCFSLVALRHRNAVLAPFLHPDQRLVQKNFILELAKPNLS
jgi:hypothetical protein